VVTGPLTDADVPEFVSALGMPGLADVHVHFMPERVLGKVWAYFDRWRADDGSPLWPIHYRLPEHARLATLRALGVVTFTSLLYPHKPGMARWLNEWAGGFAARTPGCAATATFYPEPGVDGYVADAIESGARAFKVHLQVGGFDPRDRRLVPVWRRLAAAGLPVVVHAGSGPEPGTHTGPGPMSDVLERSPDLVAVIAHMGAPEYGEFLALCDRYPRVHLDTTMAFTDFMHGLAPFPPRLVPALASHADRIVLGSDFPNIPYAYAHQLRALVRLGLGDDWLRAVCWTNGARLLGASGG
jgi:hypothetical protein